MAYPEIDALRTRITTQLDKLRVLFEGAGDLSRVAKKEESALKALADNGQGQIAGCIRILEEGLGYLDRLEPSTALDPFHVTTTPELLAAAKSQPPSIQAFIDTLDVPAPEAAGGAVGFAATDEP